MGGSQWKDIVGFEGIYQVSNGGEVKSLPRVIDCVSKWCGTRKIKIQGRILKASPLKSGHLMVRLYKLGAGRGKGKDKGVHQLVLEAFIGPCPETMEGCHGDGNPANNNLDNLRWGTRSSNAQDSIRHGTFCRGEKSGRAKLKEQDIPIIRKELEESNGVWGSMSAIARKRGVDTATIRDIRDNRTWRHVQ